MTITPKLRKRVDESPIRNLYDYYSASPYAIAPERQAELQGKVSALNIRLAINFIGEGFKFQARYENKVRQILTNLITLEKLWAMSYGFFKMQHLQQANPPGIVINAPKDIAVLLSWALNTPDHPSIEWPATMPRPDIPDSGDFIKEANELFLGMSSWVICHEVGHHEKGDPEIGYNRDPDGMVDNHAMEFSADKWAYSFILEKWREYGDGNPNILIKRGFCIGMSMIVLASKRMITLEELGSHSHPPITQRIRAYFKYLDATFGGDFPDQVGSIKINVIRVLFSVLDCCCRICDAPPVQMEHKDSDALLDYVETKYAQIAVLNKKS